jgi:hypothetical protein
MFVLGENKHALASFVQEHDSRFPTFSPQAIVLVLCISGRFGMIESPPASSSSPAAGEAGRDRADLGGSS